MKSEWVAAPLPVETRKRSLAKALSWRVIAFFTTFFIGYFVTQSGTKGLIVALIDTGIKIGLYYYHERAWLKVDYGRKPPPEYQI